ncbi:MAG: TRAP transporter permease [Alphaproteobacteria bacterium]|nr:TRAP transporter permease [Alphaproteobacteria bacterium]
MGGYVGIVRSLVAVVAATMSLWHMWIVAFGPPEVLFFRGGHLLFALVLLFLTLGASGKSRDLGPSPFDLMLVAASIVSVGYLFVNHAQLVQRIPYIDDPTTVEIVLGVLCILLVLEGTRRILGLALPLTALAFLFYAFFINRVDPLTLLDQLYLTTEGIFGSTIGVSAGYVIVFVLFGSFMERTGTGQLFMDFALALTGRQAGGPGKVAVVSSSLFGTISGSAVANVMVDGPITIPLMKRTGFRPAFAAAVESVASTGGQIMPPVMGAAAFVMAEFLATSYFQVTLWALIPAVLYYVACFAAVHFEAKRHGLVGVPEQEVPRLGRVMADRGHLFIPVLLVLGGMILGYSAPLSAFVGALSCVPVALMRKTTRSGITARTVWDALQDGARQALGVALACATAGIIIGIIALTGVGISFTALVIALAQNSLVLALILTMAAGIVLGMGMPTTPAYIVMVSLLVPALIKLGVVAPAAHMFAFYFAILSAITPPVALAVFAAAGLAKADLWESGWAAMKVGAAGFIVPFMFVYEPALLLIGDPWLSLRAFATASIGCVCLAAGLHGYFLGTASLWQRGALIGAALGLIDPTPITDLIGAVLLAIVAAAQWRERKLART